MTTTAYKFPIRELYDEVVALLETHGVGASADVVSKFGKRHVADHDKAPRYVWRPTKLRPSTDTLVTRGTSDDPEEDAEHRALASDRHHFFVECWGTSFDQASALAHNLRVACDRIGSIDVRLEQGAWTPQQGYNQLGELLIVELSLGAVLIDAFVAIPGLTTTDPETFMPTSVEGSIEVAEFLEDEGEPVLSTSTD